MAADLLKMDYAENQNVSECGFFLNRKDAVEFANSILEAAKEMTEPIDLVLIQYKYSESSLSLETITADRTDEVRMAVYDSVLKAANGEKGFNLEETITKHEKSHGKMSEDLKKLLKDNINELKDFAEKPRKSEKDFTEFTKKMAGKFVESISKKSFNDMESMKEVFSYENQLKTADIINKSNPTVEEMSLVIKQYNYIKVILASAALKELEDDKIFALKNNEKALKKFLKNNDK